MDLCTHRRFALSIVYGASTFMAEASDVVALTSAEDAAASAAEAAALTSEAVALTSKEDAAALTAEAVNAIQDTGK